MSKEQIIIVDENDNIIGHRDRNLKKEVNTYNRVSGLRVENSKGEVLIAQRSKNKKLNPGKRSIAVAGTNDKGETYESNIIKETKEEIGIDLKDFETIGKIMINNGETFCTIFKATMDYDILQFQLQKEEVANIKRINKANLKKELKENPEQFTPGFKNYVKSLGLL